MSQMGKQDAKAKDGCQKKENCIVFLPYHHFVGANDVEYASTPPYNTV
jgi:hypothetical protein